jgi:DNA polymerase-3 subunit gamma/tau
MEDIVAMAEARRDLPVKVALERCVRLIRFEPGRIELALTDDAPGNFAGELGRKLNLWTGQRWMITVGRDGAAPTLHEQRQAARAQLVTDARADPLVAAVLAQFPGAEIVDVRINGELEPPAPAGEEVLPADPEEADD